MCSKFIQKVREDRFIKIKDRQVKKFNRLGNKSSGSSIANASNNNSSRSNNQVQALENNSNSSNNHLQVEINSKWVINVSKTPLTKAQQSELAKGSNFAIVPNKIPNLDCITTIESVCHKLKEQDAGEHRADINFLLRRAQMPKSNLTKEQSEGLSQLKKDKDRLVLTADKGVAMVVLDREDYISKVESLLAQLAYRTIDRDPTSKSKAKLITTFVDDTCVIQQQAHKQAFLNHINSIDPAIKFPFEGNEGNGAIPFLDTLVTPEADNSLSTTVYHKTTHTDKYIQWDSHHNLSAKYSIIGTLTHRAKTVCTRPEIFQKE